MALMEGSLWEMDSNDSLETNINKAILHAQKKYLPELFIPTSVCVAIDKAKELPEAVIVEPNGLRLELQVLGSKAYDDFPNHIFVCRPEAEMVAA